MPDLLLTYTEKDANEIVKRLFQILDAIGRNNNKEAADITNTLIRDIQTHNGLDIVTG